MWHKSAELCYMSNETNEQNMFFYNKMRTIFARDFSQLLFLFPYLLTNAIHLYFSPSYYIILYVCVL